MVISRPCACTANMRQARAVRPSISTVQAPHTPCSQPTWVPVRPSSWRRKSASVMRASARALVGRAVDRELDRVRAHGGTRAAGRVGQRAAGQHLGEMPAVVGAGVDVGDRFERARGGGSRLDRGGIELLARSAAASASRSRTGVVAMPHSATAARRTDASPPTSTSTAAPAMAKSPRRRANSWKP